MSLPVAPTSKIIRTEFQAFEILYKKGGDDFSRRSDRFKDTFIEYRNSMLQKNPSFSTDFYIDSSADQKLGFPPGVAEDLVLRILHKWKRKCDSANEPVPEVELTSSEPEVPEVVEEVEIRTEEESVSKEYVAPVQPSDSYNGAIREDYTWSQTINDVDVLVNVPDYVRKAKDLRVEITAERIRISARTETLRVNNDLDKYEKLNAESSDWSFIFDGELSFKTQREESIWCIVPGKYVNVS